jgi:hypothetical protein
MRQSKITNSSLAGPIPMSAEDTGDFLTELAGDIELCLDNKQFAIALCSVLTIPDICSKLELREIRNVKQNRIKQARYEFWFDSYVAHRYPARGWPLTGRVLSEEEWPPAPGVTGADAYALRNAIVHGADFETPSHASRPFLDGFTFFAPTEDCSVHRCYNPTEKRAYIDVEIFTHDILLGFRQWEENVRNDLEVVRRRKNSAQLVRLGANVKFG